jgi:hypothetical protein
MKLFHEISTAAQAAFAGLDKAARQADLERSIADLPGGFASKVVSGRTYWYYQIKNPDGSLVQTYVGPDDDRTRALMARHKEPLRAQARDQLQRLARSAIELGCAQVPAKHARVIARLSDAGLFSAGAILVGTHAFLAYQNLFGIRWAVADATVDLDFAHAGRNVSLALPKNLPVDTPSAIEQLQMGFVPNHVRTSFKKADEPDFDLDFLTCRGRTGDAPIAVPRFGLSLQPLPFMELSLEAPIRATVLWRNGPIVVNLPHPARYALHKLIVFGERPQAQRVKANKDLAQAAALTSYMALHDADELRQLHDEVMARGPRWKARLQAGLAAMRRAYSGAFLDEKSISA